MSPKSDDVIHEQPLICLKKGLLLFKSAKVVHSFFGFSYCVVSLRLIYMQKVQKMPKVKMCTPEM